MTENTAPTQALLENVDTGATIKCQFNPSELSITRDNQWSAPSKAGKSVSDVTFSGMGARKMQLTLTFDSFEHGGDVTVQTSQISRLMELPAGVDSKDNSARPPHVRFRWGNTRLESFTAVITQLSQKFTLFRADGTPVRATLQLSLQEVPEAKPHDHGKGKPPGKGQNPTSHAEGTQRARVVGSGDTIDWIAAEELGDPGKWRLIAEANRLDDPRRLTPGQSLVIPHDF